MWDVYLDSINILAFSSNIGMESIGIYPNLEDWEYRDKASYKIDGSITLI